MKRIEEICPPERKGEKGSGGLPDRGIPGPGNDRGTRFGPQPGGSGYSGTGDSLFQSHRGRPRHPGSLHRALQNGTTLPRVLDLLRVLRKSTEMPIILFSYYNPIFASETGGSAGKRQRLEPTGSSWSISRWKKQKS